MPIDLAIIPVAGMGTRLLPATKSQPKEMLPVGRKPVVQYVVEELSKSGIRRLLFITSRGKSSIEYHFDSDNELVSYLRESGREEQLRDVVFSHTEDGVEFFYTRQREQRGLGDAVLCARPLVGDEACVVALGDSIIGVHADSDIVARMVDEFDRSKADIVVAFEEVAPRDVVHYGIAQPRGAAGPVFELADLVEKPAVDQAPSNLAVAARYVFSPAIFGALAETQPGKGGEIQLTDAIRKLLREGHKGVGIRLGPHERRFDVGNFRTYFRTFIEFALADKELGDDLRTFVGQLLERERNG